MGPKVKPNNKNNLTVIITKFHSDSVLFSSFHPSSPPFFRQLISLLAVPQSEVFPAAHMKECKLLTVENFSWNAARSRWGCIKV